MPKAKYGNKRYNKENPKGYGGVRNHGANKRFLGLWWWRKAPRRTEAEAKKIMANNERYRYIKVKVSGKKSTQQYYDVYVRTKYRWQTNKMRKETHNWLIMVSTITLISLFALFLFIVLIWDD